MCFLLLFHCLIEFGMIIKLLYFFVSHTHHFSDQPSADIRDKISGKTGNGKDSLWNVGKKRFLKSWNERWKGIYFQVEHFKNHHSEEQSKRKTNWPYRKVKRENKEENGHKVSQVLFWTRPDLTCSQHVSCLVKHHPSGCWHSKGPGRNQCWSADPLPPRNPGSRGNGPLREASSVSGIICRSPNCDFSCPPHKAEPSDTLLFTAELGIKPSWG